MMNAKEFLEMGLAFHGHTCPAMPLGLRAAVAAMNALGVNRSKDKELHVISETGKGHAAGCFLDGIMVATGCTYGKSNIEKWYYSKMAFTLVDVQNNKAVRVSLKPDFFAKMLMSPFVEQRKHGVLPQNIAPELAQPLVENVMSMPEERFLDIGPVVTYELPHKTSVFTAKPCSLCGEMVFENMLFDVDGRNICSGCKLDSEKGA